MKIRIQINSVPNLLYVGFKKEIGTEPKRPTPFLFFAPEEAPQNGYYLNALLKASEIISHTETLLTIEPLDFNRKYSTKVDWQELFGDHYRKTPKEIEKIESALKQARWEQNRLQAAQDADIQIAVDEAKEEGDETIQPVPSEEKKTSKKETTPKKKKSTPKPKTKLKKKAAPKKVIKKKKAKK